jgi:ABC-type lipoprotein release transport system permease subunit
MKLLTKMAWRNIWRNRRRSVLTVLAVVFASFLSIAMRGMQVGTYAVNIQNIVRMFSGALQVQREGYQANPTLELNFAFDESLRRRLAEDPRIESFTPRVYAEGLAAFKEASLGVSIVGIDVRTEPGVTTLLNRISEGSLPASEDSSSVVLGQGLARNLRIGVGQDVVLLAQGVDGTLGNMRYRVSGLIKTGSPEMDRALVMMPLKEAQELLAMGGKVHAVAKSLHNIQEIPATVTGLRTSLSGSRLSVLTWDEVLPDMRQSIQLDNISGLLFLGILVLIVGFGILNTILMSVTERFREFGVSLAMGMSSARLVTVVLLEAMFIAAVGLMLGNILAYCLNAYIVAHPIYLGEDLDVMMREFGWLPAMYSTVRFHVFFNSSLAILGATVVSCLYPAYRVWKLEPVEGMRHV